MARPRGAPGGEHILGIVTRPDAHTLVVHTVWSPIPGWGVAFLAGGAGALMGAAIGLGVAGHADGAATGAGIGAIAGYLIGTVGWAVLGGIGGDVQEITIDLQNRSATVHQGFLGVVNRDWALPLPEARRVHVWEHRGLFLGRFSPAFPAALSFTAGPTLSLGRYPTMREAMRIAEPLAAALRLPLLRDVQPETEA